MQTEYKNYYQKISQTLREELERHKINTAQLLVILLSLKQAQSKEELQAKIELLIKKYPNLSEINFKEEAENKIQNDEVIQKIIVKLITSGKSKEANDFSNFATTHSFAEITNNYPEYFN